MKCPNCGSESQGKFCKYCGTPLTQETQQQKNYEEQDGPAVENMSGEQKESGEDTYYQQPYRQETPSIPSEYKPITMWGYFGYELLFSIPCIGLILLLVFAFGGTQNVNLKNFARSYFCFLIVVVVLFAVLGSIVGIGAISTLQY